LLLFDNDDLNDAAVNVSALLLYCSAVLVCNTEWLLGSNRVWTLVNWSLQCCESLSNLLSAV